MSSPSVRIHFRIRDITADIPHIGSVGGSVQIDPDTHEVHNVGYNNSLLYEFARLGQIWDKLESDPMLVRKTLGNEKPDFSWLTNEPVTVYPPELAQV